MASLTLESESVDHGIQKHGGNEEKEAETVSVTASVAVDGVEREIEDKRKEAAVPRVHSAKQQLFKTWLEMVVHLPQYFELFVDAGYEDLSYLENMKLTEQDLTQIGIEKPGHRLKILHEIRTMKQTASTTAVARPRTVEAPPLMRRCTSWC